MLSPQCGNNTRIKNNAVLFDNEIPSNVMGQQKECKVYPRRIYHTLKFLLFYHGLGTESNAPFTRTCTRTHEEPRTVINGLVLAGES